jgi:Na+/H+ antiporter NhaD/arsenite permease-like protein
MNMVTAPLIADLFLLAIQAIGRQEVHDGTIGTESIQPIDVMVFFITLAYIAISIDASGLIRYLAFKVLQWGGKVGARLFFFLYAFFFLLGSFIGNDPIILSGTAFLAYMTRVSSNIVHPRAWIYTQFAIANIASAILVSSNPTNLVLAGAFGIKFIHYTANMIVPVVATAIVLFPFLLYIVFADEDLIPISIKMHDLPEEMRAKKPVNPNIPHARGYVAEEENDLANDEQGKLLSLEEIMNPFLDKKGATFGALIMGATLITVLVLNAASTATGEHPVFYVTLPAAFITFCWDVTFGWLNREETRQIARNGRQQIETTRAERALRKEESRHASVAATNAVLQEPFEPTADSTDPDSQQHGTDPSSPARLINNEETAAVDPSPMPATDIAEKDTNAVGEKPSTSAVDAAEKEKFQAASEDAITRAHTASMTPSNEEMNTSAPESPNLKAGQSGKSPKTLVSVSQDVYKWAQETFPTAMAVLTHLPFALVPFAFAMFVLVQALVTKGWVPVFAYGWDHWVKKTGTVGAIGGMGFLSVVLCNVCTTSILISLQNDQ